MSRLSSMLSLAISILPFCSPEISSRMGAIILHGPHHSAQKSTSTGVSANLTCSSKLASLSAVMSLLIIVPSYVARAARASDSPKPRRAFVVTPTAGRSFRDQRGSSALGLVKPALGVYSGHAARARRGHRLAVDVVLHVPTSE